MGNDDLAKELQELARRLGMGDRELSRHDAAMWAKALSGRLSNRESERLAQLGFMSGWGQAPGKSYYALYASWRSCAKRPAQPGEERKP